MSERMKAQVWLNTDGTLESISMSVQDSRYDLDMQMNIPAENCTLKAEYVEDEWTDIEHVVLPEQTTMGMMGEKRHELLAQLAHTASILHDASNSQMMVDQVRALRLYCQSFVEVWE